MKGNDMTGKAIDWDGFRADIEGITIEDSPQTVRLKSRDYFW